MRKTLNNLTKYKKLTLLIIILSVLIIGFTITYLSTPYALKYSNDYSQIISDTSKQILNVKLSKDEQWRFASTVNIPIKLQKCIITFEDKRFYTHFGIDIFAIARALMQNIKSKRIISGASTITMQLARLGRKKSKRTIFEKLLEIPYAIWLNNNYSKETVLKKWASGVSYGSNVIGFEAASWRYFGRNPNDLSWAEAALLAVLPNAPSLIFPGKNHISLVKKRNRLLSKIFHNGVIDTLTYDLAIDEDVPISFKPMPSKLPHLFQSIEKLTKKTSNNRYTITINNDIQNKVEQITNKYYNEYKLQLINNIAALVCDTKTGKIVAYVGNVGHDQDNSYEVDIIQAKRSPGSLLKPFLFAASLTDGIIAPNALINDLPVNYSGYCPKNFNTKYSGAVKASEALTKSLNVPMVRLLHKFGIEPFYSRLKECGMTTLNKPSNYYGLTLILGGAEATLYDLVKMYSGMGRVLLTYPTNSGLYNKYNYHKLSIVRTHFNNTIYNQPPLTAGAIWYTFKAMQKLKRPDQEGRWQEYSSSRRIAWKTGTSYGFRDAWAIGIDPKYTVGVWVGNSSGEGKNGLIGVYKAGPILFDIYRILSKCNKWFPKPFDDLTKMKICKHSGFLASEKCPDYQIEYLPTAVEKSQICTYCKNIIYDKKHNNRKYAQCASTNDIDTAWFVLNPAQEFFYKKSHPEYVTLPKLSSKCTGYTSNTNPIDFIYPQNKKRVFLPINLTGEKNKVVIQAVHRNTNAVLFWFIDGNYFGKTQNYHTIGLLLKKGTHKITAEDKFGNKKTINIEIFEKNR